MEAGQPLLVGLPRGPNAADVPPKQTGFHPTESRQPATALPRVLRVRPRLRAGTYASDLAGLLRQPLARRTSTERRHPEQRQVQMAREHEPDHDAGDYCDAIAHDRAAGCG